MKKFLTISIILIGLLGAAGYAVWHFGTNMASEKIINELESAIDNGNIKEIKSYIENDPKIQDIISEASTINPDALPFQTKEEATRVLIKKVGVTRLLDIKEQAQNGTLNEEAILSEIQDTLSEDEISALKYVLYMELNN